MKKDLEADEDKDRDSLERKNTPSSPIYISPDITIKFNPSREAERQRDKETGSQTE